MTVHLDTGDGGVFGDLAADLTASAVEAAFAIGSSTASLSYAIADDDVVHEGGYDDGDDFVTAPVVAGTRPTLYNFIATRGLKPGA